MIFLSEYLGPCITVIIDFVLHNEILHLFKFFKYSFALASGNQDKPNFRESSREPFSELFSAKYLPLPALVSTNCPK